MIYWVGDLLLGLPQEDAARWVCAYRYMHLCLFVCLFMPYLWFISCCHPLHHFPSPAPGFGSNVYNSSCLNCYLFPVGAAPQPLTAMIFSGPWWELDCICRTLPCSLPGPVCPDRTNVPTIWCLNMQIPQTDSCVEQGILCWIVAVQFIVNSRDL